MPCAWATLGGVLCGLVAGCGPRHAASQPADGYAAGSAWRAAVSPPSTMPAAYGLLAAERPTPGPLTVERAVREALAASPWLEQVRQRIAAAGAQVRLAEAAFYPRLVISQDFTATDNPVYALMYIINQKRFSTDINFNSPGQQQNAASVVQGQWTLFDGTSRWYTRGAAQAEQASTEADLRAAQNELVAKVTETYYRWLEAMDFVNVASRAVKVARTDEKLAEDRLEQEMALRSEVWRLKANRAAAEGDLVTAKGNARKLRAAVERLLTRRIGDEEIPKISPPAAPTEAAAGRADTLVRKALQQRAEMAATEALVTAAVVRVKAAKGALLPNVAAHADYTWNSWDLTDAQGSWMAGVQATWNIFEGGATLARINAAKCSWRR